MKRPLLLIGLCALLASCAQHPAPHPVADQASVRAASPHRARRVAATTHVKRTPPLAKATTPATPAAPCVEASTGEMSDARANELLAEFDNHERSGPAAPVSVPPVSRACP